MMLKVWPSVGTKAAVDVDIEVAIEDCGAVDDEAVELVEQSAGELDEQDPVLVC